MDAAVFIARIFGLLYLVAAIGMMANREFYQKVMEDFCKNSTLVLYGGLLALITGVVIILIHNVWVANWTVIITIIGWAGLIKGIWIIVFPGTVSRFMQAYQKNENLIMVHSIAALILGAVLTFFGFFAG